MQAQSVTLDFLKPVGTVVDLSDKFNARVGDSMTPFNLFVTEGGKPKALNGLHPELEAAVGDGELKDGKVVMSDNAKGTHWVGNADNVTGYNRLTLTFPAEVFPQSGFCYGHLILANDAGVRESSVDIWFKVLDGLAIMGLAADYYDSAIELELKKLKEANSQAEQRLSEMKARPQAFANLDDLKAKYPVGNSNLNVTVDDGHLWIWLNGGWRDCGQFQGKGIANRSVDNLSLKEKTLTLRTSQSTPWIIDFDNREFTVSDASYFYDDQAYLIPKGVYSLSDYATIYVGYDTVTEKFGGYVHYSDMPESSYFMGSVDFANRKAFLQFDCVDSEMIPSGQIAKATKMSRANLPAPATGLVSFSPWTVNVYDDNPTITVNGYASYVTKGSFFGIKPGTYTFKQNNAGSYYVYLDLDYKNLTADIKATDMPWNIPVNSPWIGFIETNNHIYRIFNNSNNTSYPLSLVTDERFTVDFQKGTLYVPVIWHTVNPLKNGTPTNSGAEVSFDKSQTALYVGMDPSQLDINKMFIFSPDISVIQNGYQYLGWISILTEEYDFGQYGSSRDLVLQPWLNRKVACLGDSITQGDSGEGSLIDSYVPRLKKYIGTNAQNFGKNGALITKKTDDDISFVNRVGAIEDQDVVTIFGGINDFQWNAPLGTMADGIDKPTTFFGALKYVITTLAANNPKAKLMLITPMKTTKFQYHTYDNNGNLMQNANGNTQLDFVNAIKQVGEYYSIPVLDMYSNSNYSPYLPSQVGHDNFTADGLHPTAHGYERIAQTIGHAINNL